MSKQRVISFPHMGDYHIPIRTLFQRLYPDAEVRPAPPITKETAALGARHSPDFICEPFKYNMGNFIEALESGATMLLQTGTGCRYGYYGELQEQILRDLGYEFKFLCLNRERAHPRAAYQTLKQFGSPLSVPQTAHALLIAMASIRAMDRLAGYVREHTASVHQPEDMSQIYSEFLKHLRSADSLQTIRTLDKSYGKQLRRLPQAEIVSPLKVGIVGDLYTVMEPFANYDLEQRLLARGVSVSRRMSLTFLLFGPPRRQRLRAAGGYLRHPVGANGLDSVAQSLAYAISGYDGILHIKSFGCTPELNAVPALMNISTDYQIPILHLSFDTHTSPTGLETRIEAFLDMIAQRRETRADIQPGRRHRFHLHQGRHPR
ncbi:MAG: hypothetical protein FWE12_08625 [Oscillospiraceae bacterium]|nr:hypothetical protein [Oscillospiraceae bacterium]